MLAPDGREVLVELLKPPPGSELVRGVATTFTLDLTSALVAPLSFAGHRLGTDKDPVAIMQAVNMASDRIDIFCQAGQIAVPSPRSDLVACLESMVHPVASPHPGGLFHPKIWLLEFSDGTETTFRLLCASRNLTADRSWDVVVRLDGTRGPRPLPSNGPLRDLTARLPSWAIVPLKPERTARLHDLAESVRYAAWDPPEHVGEVVFHALGVTRRRSLLNFVGTRHLVISPFATNDGLERVGLAGSASMQLIARVEDLDRLDPGTLGQLDSTWVIDDSAAMEQTDETSSRSDLLVGLHAKTYVIEHGHSARLLVGSANATQAAFNGNIEFLIEMVGPKSKLGIETFVGADAPFRQMLLGYQAVGGVEASGTETADRRLEVALRSLASSAFAAAATPDGERFTVKITTDADLQLGDVVATVELLTQPGDQAAIGSPVEVMFSDVALVDVTPFLVLRVTDDRQQTRAAVVKAALTGDPPGRHDELLARQLDTPEKFLRFLALLLSFGGAGDLGALLGAGAGSGSGSWGVPQIAVFETLVRALATSRSALEDIAGLVDRLRRSETGRDVLPPGFGDLWDLIWAARCEMAESGS
jgi:hypothetical protein